MTEKELFTLLGTVLTSALAARYAPTVIDVRQADQPSLQGRPSGPAVLLSNQPAVRYGFLKREDKWDHNAELMVHTETQIMLTTFQCGALWPQDPKALDASTSPTASDLVDFAAMVLQSDVVRYVLNGAGVGVLRVTDVRRPYMKDDQDRFEASPSFDFTLTHRLVVVSATPIVDRTTPNLVAI